MRIQSLEDLLPKAKGSVYCLVRMASQRALELADGKRCLVDKTISDKSTTLALEEIQQGKVVIKAAIDQLAAVEEDVENQEEIVA